MTLNEYETLAWMLLEDEGLANQGWSFDWNNRRRHNGLCHYGKKTIYLSRILTPLRSEDNVVETIHHEVAHALTPGAKHGDAWRAQMRKYGYKAEVAYTRDEKKVDLSHDYKYLCMFGDEVVHGWFRRPNKNTFATIHERYMPGRKAETLGKLRIVEV